jgi:hypothetical protein
MRAQEHTEAMLEWLRAAGVNVMDAAARRPGGKMIWLPGASLSPRELAWARAENARGAEVYARAARGGLWPVVFLDDVEPGLAARVAGKYRALAVRTSRAGGCHLWLACSRPLTEEDRCRAQRWLARAAGADPGSISGEHLGRLAGFKNWKRGGEWVNVAAASQDLPAWTPVLDDTPQGAGRVCRGPVTGCPGSDASESAKEWGWVCGALQSGCPEEVIRERLLARAASRRGTDAPRYAKRTVEMATRHVKTKNR